MNFFNVTATSDNGTTVLKNANMELPIPERMKGSVQQGSTELTAGMRPEHFQVSNGGNAVGARVRATTDVVEFLGNEELLHVRVGDNDLVAIVDASHRVRPGDVLDLFVPMEKIHLFDTEDGKALAKD